MAAKLCNVCNIRRAYTGAKGTETAAHGSEMCNYCYEEGTWENSHNDEGHDDKEFPVREELTSGCWICHPELNLAQKSDERHFGVTKAQGTRRPQLNHKGHSHPQTPAARRACKAAFWASLTPVVNVSSTEQLAAAMQAWNHSCDGHGKPWVKVPGTAVEAATDGSGKTRPATWTVAPRGPKGGVINQLKAGKGKPSK
jgi:hypothetical protein